MLAKSKFNSIKTVVSQALINLEISHEEFVVILKEKKKYEKMKENVKNVSKKQENMRLKCQFKAPPPPPTPPLPRNKKNEIVDNLRNG